MQGMHTNISYPCILYLCVRTGGVISAFVLLEYACQTGTNNDTKKVRRYSTAVLLHCGTAQICSYIRCGWRITIKLYDLNQLSHALPRNL